MRGKMRDFDAAYAVATPTLISVSTRRRCWVKWTAGRLCWESAPKIFRANWGIISARRMGGGFWFAKFASGHCSGEGRTEGRGRNRQDKRQAGEFVRRAAPATCATKAMTKSVNLGILRKGSAMSVAITIEKPKPRESTHMVRRAQLIAIVGIHL